MAQETSFKTRVLQLFTMVAFAGAAAALTSNCGGSDGQPTGQGGTSGGGSGGSGGMSGAGGGVNQLVCTGGTLDCTDNGSINPMADGKITDFSPEEWNQPAGKWCNPSGLRGSTFGYPPRTAVDGGSLGGSSSVVTGSYLIDLVVESGGYAGAGLSFDSCVDASAFNAVEFSVALVSGDLTGCIWQLQLQTQEQRPSNLSNPTGGLCDPDAGGCHSYPTASLDVVPTPTRVTVTAPFSSFFNTAVTQDTFTQLVGIQWQANSNGGSCSVVLSIDDIRFITM